MYCKNCGTQVPEGYRFCSGCGAEQPRPAVKKEKNLLLVPMLLGAVLLVALIVGGWLLLCGPGGDEGDRRQSNPDREETEEAGETGDVSWLPEDPETVYVLTYMETESFEENQRQTVTLQWTEDGQLTSCAFREYAENDLLFFYDENGLLTGLEAEGISFTFLCDSQGNILQEQYSQDGEQRHRREYTYDSRGNLLTFIQWNADDLLHKDEQYTYNDKNICVYSDKIEYRPNTGEIRWRTVSTYDGETGLFLSGRGYTGSEEKLNNGSDYEYTYSADGRTRTIAVRDLDGEISMTYEYVFDEKGNAITYSAWLRDGSFYFRHEYTYDDRGNMLSDIMKCEDEDLSYHYAYTYDEHGNLLSEAELDEDGQMLWCKRYTYQPMELEPYQQRFYEQLAEILDPII